MLRKEGPQKWVQDENRNIGQMIFRFKDKESPRSYISGLVHSLQVRYYYFFFINFDMDCIIFLGISNGKRSVCELYAERMAS